MANIQKYDNSINQTMEWCNAMAQGDLLPQQYRNKPANIMFAAEYADAIGVSRIHVLTSIAVINGRPSPSADLMASMARTAGHRLRVTVNEMSATAVLIRKDDPDFKFSATWDEARAKRAKLWGKSGPWSQYPEAMLRSRAISEVIRLGCPEVMAGAIYTPEEMESTDIQPHPVQVSETVGRAAQVVDEVSAIEAPQLGRSADEILASLESAGSVDDVKALWVEAREAGHVELLETIAAVGKSFAAQVEGVEDGEN